MMQHTTDTPHKTVASLLLSGLSLLLGAPLQAAVTLHQQDWNNSISGATSIQGTNQQDVVDRFTPTEDWSVTSASWVAHLYSGTTAAATRDFVIEIFSDVGGSPSATPIFTTTTTANTGLISTDGTISSYTFTGTFAAAAALASGVDYYFSVTDHGPNTSGSNGMGWGFATSGTDRFFRSGNTGSWIGPGSSMAYTLLGEVPEPGSIMLLSVGVLAASLRRRRL